MLGGRQSRILLAVVLLTVAACSPQARDRESPSGAPVQPVGGSAAEAARTASPAAPSRVTFAVADEMGGWSPYAQNAATGYSAWMHINEPLARLEFKDGRGYFAPVLAERWDTDATTWTFHLRPGVTFSDGSALTAADVLFSWQRMMTDSDSLQAGQLKAYVQSMEAPDPHTFRVVLKEPNAVFLDEVRNRYITNKGPRPPRQRAGRSQPIRHGALPIQGMGLGAALRACPQPQLLGRAAPGGRGRLPIHQGKRGRVGSSAQRRGRRSRQGGPHQVSRISGRAHVEAVDGLRHVFLILRPNVAPTDSVLVRQAIYHAIDRAPLTANVLGGYATELKGPVQSSVVGYDPTLPTYDYDVIRARESYWRRRATPMD